jgi:DNA-binding response OmpR family regulator
MKKILVIDDDQEYLKLIQEILNNDYQVTLLSDGSDVINTIHRSQPDLILLDVMLGGIDGRDICRQIKNHRNMNSIPVVMITATNDVRDIFDDFVPDDFISKPFKMDQLLHIVKNQLQQ